MEVVFWVEGDILDEEGNCCFDIQKKEELFSILSCHYGIYEGDHKNINQAYANAIQRHHEKIKCIGHPCKKNISEYLDIEALAKVLNQYQIPIEINCSNITTDRTDFEKLHKLLPLVEAGIYVNSDMHTLNDFSFRQVGFDYLKEQWFLSA